MNPDENQTSTGGPAPVPSAESVAPAAPTEPVEPTGTPDLSQIAADLAAAAENNSLEQETPAAEPAVQTESMNPVEPTPAEPSAPVESATDPAPLAETTPAESPTEVPAVEPVNLAPLTPEEASETEQPTPVKPVENPVENFSEMATETPADAPVEAPMETPAETPLETASVPESPVAPPDPAFEQPTPEQPAPATPAMPEQPVEQPLEQPTSNDSPAQLADFTGEAQADEEASAAPVIDEDNPIEPAAPVPGSIGSALAYSEDAPGHAVPVVHEKDKTKKKNLQLILIIVGAVALIAVVVVVILFILSGNSNKKTTTVAQTQNVSEPVMSSLTCTLSDDQQNLQLYGALSAEEKLIATYYDDELYDISTTISANFLDVPTAELGESNFKKLYNDKMSTVGYTSDPFDSTYTRNDTSVSVSHYASADDIDEDNASIFDINVSSSGEIESDIESLKQVYKNLRYTCSSRNNK